MRSLSTFRLTTAEKAESQADVQIWTARRSVQLCSALAKAPASAAHFRLRGCKLALQSARQR